MAMPVDPPTLTLGVDDLVDWLELTALFDPFGIARLDALLGSLLELEESSEDNIGERDKQREQLVEKIENEVDIRQKKLGEAYPFNLSDTGEELFRHEDWRDRRFSFYLICLVTTHVTNSPILRTPPTGALLNRSAFAREATEGGWAMAGAWAWRLAAANEQLIRATGAVPQVAPPKGEWWSAEVYQAQYAALAGIDQWLDQQFRQQLPAEDGNAYAVGVDGDFLATYLSPARFKALYSPFLVTDERSANPMGEMVRTGHGILAAVWSTYAGYVAVKTTAATIHDGATNNLVGLVLNTGSAGSVSMLAKASLVVIESAGPGLFFALFALFVAGAFLAYILPVWPFLIWFYAVVQYLVKTAFSSARTSPKNVARCGNHSSAPPDLNRAASVSASIEVFHEEFTVPRTRLSTAEPPRPITAACSKSGLAAFSRTALTSCCPGAKPRRMSKPASSKAASAWSTSLPWPEAIASIKLRRRSRPISYCSMACHSRCCY